MKTHTPQQCYCTTCKFSNPEAPQSCTDRLRANACIARTAGFHEDTCPCYWEPKDDDEDRT